MRTVSTKIDAKTNQLHIGNRWIGHKGLDLYDNTARMHDPLLARYHTADPLWSDYPSQSPWSHCAANPLNFIDPTGMRAIYSPQGNFLGVDETGFEGDFIIMDESHYNTGMSYAEANKYSIKKSDIELHILNAVEDHFYNVLPTRPDYDGYITWNEACAWYNNKSGKTLYADLRKLDLSDVKREKFVNGRQPFNTVALDRLFIAPSFSDFTFSTAVTPCIDVRKLREGIVYGHINLTLKDNVITAEPDIFDFDMHKGSSIKTYIRNFQTKIAEKLAGKGNKFTIEFYGSWLFK